ncbi:uncharacterized protein LOC134350867 isoform X2 [Mobula hypostoma]|uniref:uncharacterized protein LOC134350867 isoform X2 n=1 Tax=Mobula hypostoma TaxID=723540 RepID=UPI002FC32C35
MPFTGSQKSPAVGEKKITPDPGLFHKGTEVFRVSWMDSSSWWRRLKTYQCPTVIQTVKQSLIDRTRSRGGSCSGQSEYPPGGETLVVSEQSASSISSGCSQRKNSWNSERLQCNVQRYGRGDVHEKIVKELKICQCEGPGVPCVLFVYKVSHENQDLRDALQWVTGGGTVRKEDICSVILLQKSRDFRVNKMINPGLFHEGINVFQIFWTEASVTWASADEGHAVIQTVRQSLINKTKSRGGSCPGSSEDPQGSETPSCSAPTSMCREQPDHLTSSTCTQVKSEESSERFQCNVQCYGRGAVHEEIVKQLNINECEWPRIPCVLFVYNVYHEIEDFRNALQWVTGGRRARKEDICAVILLQKSLDVGEGKIRTYPGLFHEATAVHRVLWRETSDIFKRRSADCHCPNTIRAIRQSLSDRTRSREHSSSGSSEDQQGSETLSLCSEPTSMCREQPDHLTSSSRTQEKSEKSSEELQCNVQCYGRGDVHEEIVKQLNINECEWPRIPCVLFVYNVSHEIEDFRNALQWVTGGGRAQKEDICAVILLQKSRDVGDGKLRTYPGLFHEGTAVHRVLWRETSGTLKRRSADCQCPNTIRAIRQRISDRTRSREHSSPGSSEDPQGSETPSLCSEQLDHSTSSTCTQEKSKKSSVNLQCNAQVLRSRGFKVLGFIWMECSGKHGSDKESVTDDPGRESSQRNKHIHRVVIGTKSELLGIPEKHNARIYEYEPLQRKFEMLAERTGMERRFMFVVSNQWRGGKIEMIKCILALYVLDNMVRNIDRFLKAVQ